jgi:prolyl-tRNA synthetase
LRIVADEALRGRRNMIAGANRDDYHLRGVTPGEDFAPEYFDLRQVAGGDACRDCGAILALSKTVEIGHIFKLGYKYSQAMGLHVTNEAGEEVAPIMGSYGIGMERILCAAIELYHDQDGMSLPAAIAPFTVIVTPVNFNDTAQREAAERIYRECLDQGLDALLDDRDERPGVKFKDADLIGAPWRIVAGKKLAEGLVEVIERGSREKRDVPVGEAAALVAAQIGGASGR